MKKEKLEEEHNTLMKVIFGDEETGLMGMKAKVDEIHDILISVRSVNKFFGGVGTTFKWLIILGAVIGVIKGWWVALLGTIVGAIK